MRRLARTLRVLSMTRAAPAIAVVMPVRNAAPYLDASIGSIVGQTFKDLELIIVDDASNDGSDAVIQRWVARDSRIHAQRSEQRLGVVGGGNAAVAEATAPLVARMDADDISHPERLARQFDVMQRHPEAVGVGALSDGIDAAGRRVRPPDAWRLTRRSPAAPFPHGSIMFRRHLFDVVGGYREPCAGWEDQDFLLRLARTGPILVLPEVLYHYRHHVGSSTTSFSDDHAARVEAQRRRCIAAFAAGRDYDELLTTEQTVTQRRGDFLRYAGALRLWAGERPGVFGTMMREGASPGALAWAAWASVHPASLKSFTRMTLHLRNLAARPYVRPGRTYQWRSE